MTATEVNQISIYQKKKPTKENSLNHFEKEVRVSVMTETLLLHS